MGQNLRCFPSGVFFTSDLLMWEPTLHNKIVNWYTEMCNARNFSKPCVNICWLLLISVQWNKSGNANAASCIINQRSAWFTLW
jgi:hypothetical protein